MDLLWLLPSLCLMLNARTRPLNCTKKVIAGWLAQLVPCCLGPTLEGSPQSTLIVTQPFSTFVPAFPQDLTARHWQMSPCLWQKGPCAQLHLMQWWTPPTPPLRTRAHPTAALIHTHTHKRTSVHMYLPWKEMFHLAVEDGWVRTQGWAFRRQINIRGDQRCLVYTLATTLFPAPLQRPHKQPIVSFLSRLKISDPTHDQHLSWRDERHESFQDNFFFRCGF